MYVNGRQLKSPVVQILISPFLKRKRTAVRRIDTELITGTTANRFLQDFWTNEL
jgi:hypothetical protein